MITREEADAVRKLIGHTLRLAEATSTGDADDILTDLVTDAIEFGVDRLRDLDHRIARAVSASQLPTDAELAELEVHDEPMA